MTDQTRFLDLRGIRLRARSRGDAGADCLCLHGWLDTGASFDALARFLESTARIHALDLRGHGESSWVGAGGFYHFSEYLADIDAALDALELRAPIRLIGHSMGASLALLYAAARPERVSHVALLDGMPLLVKASEVPERIAQYLDDLKSIPRARKRVDSLEHAVERLRKASPNLRLDAARALAAAGVSPDPAQGNALAWRWDPWLRAHSPLPFTADILAELLPRVTAKLLLLRAGHTWLPEEPELREKLQALRAPLTIATLAETSHHLHIEEPAQVAERILAHWRP